MFSLRTLLQQCATYHVSNSKQEHGLLLLHLTLPPNSENCEFLSKLVTHVSLLFGI